jgi:sterol desaturase/sphingolipid hydroxylase (fatty acid hydroxylase superfamily)
LISEMIDLAVSFLAFGIMARLWPCNAGQPRFLTPEFVDNALYSFFGILIYGDLATIYIRAGVGMLFQHDAPGAMAAILAGYGPVGRLPVVVQALAILLGLDFVQYWLHRLFHGHTLWPFHAIHHSAEVLDWSTTYRIHPVNYVIYGAGALALIRVAGFSPAAFAIIAPFNLVIGPLVHANVNWTFGPFRYLLVSPVYHRWHHSKDLAARDRNFAPTFPIWDLMFGTYYMPRGVLPGDYGVDGVPSNFLGQLIYPFRVWGGRLGLWPKTRTSEAAA